MTVRVYISGISGNKEVKKRQQRVLMILDSKNVSYDLIDITEPGKENEKDFMLENGKARDSKHPLPPQIFNEQNYCGDYEDFDMANELDELEKFLSTTNECKTEKKSDVSESKVVANGTATKQENGIEKEKLDVVESSAAETILGSSNDKILTNGIGVEEAPALPNEEDTVSILTEPERVIKEEDKPEETVQATDLEGTTDAAP